MVIGFMVLKLYFSTLRSIVSLGIHWGFFDFVLDAPAVKTFNPAAAQIAQSVEQGIENPRVGGSIPSLGTTNTEQKASAMRWGFLLSVGKNTETGPFSANDRTSSLACSPRALAASSTRSIRVRTQIAVFSFAESPG